MESLFMSDKKTGKDEVISLSDKYTLTIENYNQGEEYWNLTKGIIRNSDGEIIFEIKRNYCDFWYKFISHLNGNDYLLCGEDYQGYNVLNLTTQKNYKYMSDGAAEGFGFCWSSVESSPNAKKILVCGCMWGGPYQYKIFDFTNPDEPLRELFDDKACFEFDFSGNWISDEIFEFTQTNNDSKEIHEYIQEFIDENKKILSYEMKENGLVVRINLSLQII